jgi:predicted alpha/beta-hydrolase family hydrolase
MMRGWLLAAVLCLAALPAPAQDFEREARWRAEVVPNLVVGEAVDLRTTDGRAFLGLYTASAGAKTALVIVHGIGVHPDHGVIGTLRMALADKGFTTLSIQMPVQVADAPADAYARLMPLAAERIGAAAAWLAARGYRDLVLVSHSMGSRMANAYFDGTGKPSFRGWVALGLGGDYSRRFAETRPVPVLDVQGEADLPSVLKTAAARRLVAESTAGGRQISIAGADHFYAGRHAELIAAIAAFAAGPM